MEKTLVCIVAILSTMTLARAGGESEAGSHAAFLALAAEAGVDLEQFPTVEHALDHYSVALYGLYPDRNPVANDFAMTADEFRRVVTPARRAAWRFTVAEAGHSFTSFMDIYRQRSWAWSYVNIAAGGGVFDSVCQCAPSGGETDLDWLDTNGFTIPDIFDDYLVSGDRGSFVWDVDLIASEYEDRGMPTGDTVAAYYQPVPSGPGPMTTGDYFRYFDEVSDLLAEAIGDAANWLLGDIDTIRCFYGTMDWATCNPLAECYVSTPGESDTTDDVIQDTLDKWWPRGLWPDLYIFPEEPCPAIVSDLMTGQWTDAMEESENWLWDALGLPEIDIDYNDSPLHDCINDYGNPSHTYYQGSGTWSVTLPSYSAGSYSAGDDIYDTQGLPMPFPLVVPFGETFTGFPDRCWFDSSCGW